MVPRGPWNEPWKKRPPSLEQCPLILFAYQRIDRWMTILSCLLVVASGMDRRPVAVWSMSIPRTSLSRCKKTSFERAAASSQSGLGTLVTAILSSWRIFSAGMLDHISSVRVSKANFVFVLLVAPDQMREKREKEEKVCNRFM